MNNKTKTLILPACVLFVLIALITTSAQANEKVVYRLKWLRNVSVVGALYAETHHLFEKAGLDVEVKAGGIRSEIRSQLRSHRIAYID